ncbi:uncharacterized protein BP01DRAFT_177645 [Aspergillus saccharolyticus JOP 1030-1]|uniref:Uncharacterized protein n=1 Tax=Aspergillus saccharolyticus JOP 1030-1 TaxID=1450539 RepID=A0A318ZMJ6_9EURO|nr:hypothetical protein BP01DRAFT_177645 [Aspergillus saccharolyticus JOP 1030-1]PYH48197.1 hypothetical protein BP01DRAFT_177645 [Aspergillus saccharolyticus JOP 1030-1]
MSLQLYTAFYFFETWVTISCFLISRGKSSSSGEADVRLSVDLWGDTPMRPSKHLPLVSAANFETVVQIQHGRLSFAPYYFFLKLLGVLSINVFPNHSPASFPSSHLLSPTSIRHKSSTTCHFYLYPPFDPLFTIYYHFKWLRFAKPIVIRRSFDSALFLAPRPLSAIYSSA